jgi:flagellar biosynthetic protein FlhB
MPVDDQERTEEATPKRREEARKKGQVAKSQEVGSALLLLGGLLAMSLMGAGFVERSVELFLVSFASFSTTPLTQSGVADLAVNAMQASLVLFFPVVAFMAVVGALGSILQHGIVFSTDQIDLQWDRISPIAGFKRIFSLRSLVQFLKTMLKFVAVTAVTYFVIRRQMPTVVASIQADPRQVLSLSSEVVGQLVLWAGVVIAFLGAADYLFERWEFERSIRMSRHELREELRQTEGDPMLRARIRTIQREMARKRMIAEVPKADVIVTNPTELAVAILYVQGEMGAPRVVAKGAGFLAAKIREIAREHGVPLVENKPVARALHRSVKVGAQVPSNLYRAVAEILAYVYRIKAQKSGLDRANVANPGTQKAQAG